MARRHHTGILKRKKENRQPKGGILRFRFSRSGIFFLSVTPRKAFCTPTSACAIISACWSVPLVVVFPLPPPQMSLCSTAGTPPPHRRHPPSDRHRHSCMYLWSLTSTLPRPADLLHHPAPPTPRCTPTRPPARAWPKTRRSASVSSTPTPPAPTCQPRRTTAASRFWPFGRTSAASLNRTFRTRSRPSMTCISRRF